MNDSPLRRRFNLVLFGLLGLVLLGSTTLALAQTRLAQTVAERLPPAAAQPHIADGLVAPTARAEVQKLYPEYMALVDSLIQLGMSSTANGMTGAPTQPGDIITFAAEDAQAVRDLLKTALPNPGQQTTVTLTEAQLTAWAVDELQNNPDVPVHDLQVFLRDGKIQVWGLIQGEHNATSGLIVGGATVNAAGDLTLFVDSAQFGQFALPGPLVSQGVQWLNERLTQEIAAEAPGLRITGLTIVDGEATITGER